MWRVRSLVITEWHAHLKQGELRPFFEFESPTPPYDLPQPLHDLTNLAHSPDFDEKSRKVYQDAVERLQWVFAISRFPYERHNTVRWLLGWAVQLEAEFIAHLNQRKPEALIILAYFGLLVDSYGDCWVIGNSGQVLMQAIQSYLGPFWSKWLEYPMSFVSTQPG
jgi:hypothetical protein